MQAKNFCGKISKYPFAQNPEDKFCVFYLNKGHPGPHAAGALLPEQVRNFMAAGWVIPTEPKELNKLLNKLLDTFYER